MFWFTGTCQIIYFVLITLAIHYSLSLSLKSDNQASLAGQFIHSFVSCHSSVHDILTMNKLILMQIDTSGTSPLPPFGHIWDVMLVWRKGNIEKTVSVLQYCVLLQWCTRIRAVLGGRSTVSGFDLAWFSSLSSKRLCVFGLHGAVWWSGIMCCGRLSLYAYEKKKMVLYRSFSLPFSELSGRIGPWPGWLTIVLQCYDTVGWVIWLVKSSPKWALFRVGH